jgi:hypothetical protein
MDNETELRRELQLVLLREGFTQDYAREAAADWVITPETIAKMEQMREDAKRFPARQILPPGTIDIADIKSQNEEALCEIEEQKYYANQAKLSVLMAESFSLPEMSVAVLQTLLFVLEEGGIERMAAIAEIIKTVEFLQKVTEHNIARGV